MNRREGEVAEAWDAEYTAGRYARESPMPFADDILAAAGSHDLIGQPGLYIGCGNGRNYLPLIEGGLDLVGLDISEVAIDQLGEKLPERRAKLIAGDLSALPSTAVFALVVGIQVFQHGDRRTAHRHLRAAQERVAPDGLFCVRVNAIGTDIAHAHHLKERESDGSLTVRYLDGPKAGLDVHFFSEAELALLFDGWKPVVPLRAQVTWRLPPEQGQWTQWEAIWRHEALVQRAE